MIVVDRPFHTDDHSIAKIVFCASYFIIISFPSSTSNNCLWLGFSFKVAMEGYGCSVESGEGELVCPVA